MKVIILNRLTGPLARYSDWISEHHDILFIYNSEGNPSDSNLLPHWNTKFIENFDDFDGICRMIQNFANGLPVDAIIANSENILKIASRLRERFDIPGLIWSKQPWIVDKYEMKRALTASPIHTVPGIKISLGEFPKENSLSPLGELPWIIKPVDASASQGVKILGCQSDLTQCRELIKREPSRCWLIEKFIAGNIYHIDGFVQNETISEFVAFQYIGNCFEFYNDRKSLGSISTPDEDGKLKQFTNRVIKALRYKSGVFHLELIRNGDDLYFLEIASRVGGGLIPQVFLAKTGYYLPKVATQLELGMSPLPVGKSSSDEVGVLLVPVPRKYMSSKNVRVKTSRLMGTPPEAMTCFEAPNEGSVISTSCHYPSWAKFTFTHSSAHMIEQAIQNCLDELDFSFEEVD